MLGRFILPLLFLPSIIISQTPLPPQGFSFDASIPQRSHEERALSEVSERMAEQFLFDLTKEPHHAGSPGGRRVAEYVQRRFRKFGFDSKIVEYDVLLPYPVEVNVSILDPIEKQLAIKEKVEFHPEALIPFNAYSPSADLTSQIVYVNYGTPQDFEKLMELGIDVNGKCREETPRVGRPGCNLSS